MPTPLAFSDILKVSLVQTKLHWEDKTANLAQFDKKLQAIREATDLVILPEMFTTGFSMQPKKLAEPMDGPTVFWLKEKAQQLNAVITGSFICMENGLYFNRLVWMQPDGNYFIYDKRHLFTLAKEEDHYTAGKKRLIVDLKGWKILPLICYDLRFPVWSRNDANYDLLLYVANFPERRVHAWSNLLIARAIENQCYTIGVNRVGEDGNGVSHSGASAIVDYEGQTRYQVNNTEGIFTMALSFSAQQNFREKLQFLADQDKFKIDIN